MQTKITEKTILLSESRTKEQENSKTILFSHTCTGPSPIIIQDLNDIFVHSQKFFFSAKKIVYHLFLLLILPNIVLY